MAAARIRSERCGPWLAKVSSNQVTTVVLANRHYAVLKREFSYLGIGSPGTRALDIFEIGRPDSRLGALGQGHGKCPAPVSLRWKGSRKLCG